MSNFKLKNGFLPEVDPLERLPKAFDAWEEVAKNLPKLLIATGFQKLIDNMPPFEAALLQSEREYERAMQLLSYIGHAYVWGKRGDAPQKLPEQLAMGWYNVAKKLGRPPVLSYASYSLNNWKRIDPEKGVDLGNIVLIQNFLGGLDEEWFVLVHVDIEDKAIPAVQACIQAIHAKNPEELIHALQTITHSLTRICSTLERMPEACDPYIYYNRVRPYLHGWKHHRSFPKGLIYEGVKEYGGVPQQFLGETGAQSSIMPSLDGLFGITHSQDELYHYLREMRDYMPPEHRQFVAFCETSTVRNQVLNTMSTHPRLKELYNEGIELIERFRTIHLTYAANYVHKQHEMSQGNPKSIGTGGTPFMQYLTKHKEETLSFLL